jgi:hypothetical protein
MKNHSAFYFVAGLSLIFAACFQPVDLGETFIEEGTAYLRVTNDSEDESYILEGLELRNAEDEVEQSWDGLGLEVGNAWEVHTESAGSFTLWYRVKDRAVSDTAVEIYEGGTVEIELNRLRELSFKGEVTVTQQDADGDGLPDAWELENGFDPEDPGDGGTVYVGPLGQDEAPGNGTQSYPYLTLAKAVDKAGRGLLVNGDDDSARTVVVLGELTLTSGNDHLNKEYPGRADSVFYLGKTRNPVTIRGESQDKRGTLTVGSSNTPQRRVLYLDSGAGITLRDMIITGGRQDGGGIYATGAKLTLGPGATVTKNQNYDPSNDAAIDCGGIYMERGVLIMQEGSSVTENTGGLGGGVRLINSKFTMEKYSEISGNRATFACGGLHVADSTVEMLDGAKISGNVVGAAEKNAGHSGGGVELDSFSTLTMHPGSEISGNVVHNGFGGGISMTGESTLIMKGGVISGNKCIMADNFKNAYNGFSGRGGGVALTNGSSFIMEGGIIAGNQAARAGGGLCFTEGDNTFTMRGGTIYGKNNPATTNDNGYLSENEQDTVRGGHAIMIYSLANGGKILRQYNNDVNAGNFLSDPGQ